MQIQAVQGYFTDQNKFIPYSDVTIPLWKRSIVTFLDEPAKTNSESDDTIRKLAELDILNTMVDASADEELPVFERIKINRGVAL